MDYKVIDYSEKAIAVCGDTKAIKDELKKIGGRFNPRLSCGAGWIFSKSKRDQVTAILNGETVTVTEEAPTPKKAKGIADDIKAEIIAYYTKVWGERKKMTDYCVNEIAHAVRLSNGLILTISKPKIQTRFCFGESGYDYDEAKNMAYNVAKTEDYFKSANMRKFDSMIEDLKKTRETNQWGGKEMYAYIRVQSYYSCEDRVLCKAYTNGVCPERAAEREYEPLPDADIDTAIALYEEARAAFKKRVDAYWKRYGASKLKTWTYWRDA